MFTRTTAISSTAIAIALFCGPLLSQQKSAPVSAPPVTLEFPVTMQQKVVAGKTPAGTKVTAKLVVATLVNGVVIPRNAIFSGEVTDSVAKSAARPSRLGLRMDSVQWKKGSATVKVYLTAWYYPMRITEAEPLSYGPAAEAGNVRNWNGAGAYPDLGAPASQPFPTSDAAGAGGLAPVNIASNISDHRVPMKSTMSLHKNDGSVAIASAASNLKLDKLTTYVLATGDLLSLK